MTNSAGVVIVSFRTPKYTLAAARSALDAGADAVTVVDNASHDATVGLLRALGDARLSIIEQPANVGFGIAANAGAKALGTDSLVFLNSDAELSRAAMTELISELRRLHGRALLGPRIVGDGGAIQRSAGLLPHPSDLALRALGLHVVARGLAPVPLIGRLLRQSRLAGEYDSATEAQGPMDTSMVSGACFAVGRTTFEELGGFDERFFMYFEDADLCRRATRAGIPIRYLPAAVVTHAIGASSEGDYRFSPMHARSMRQYLQKWWGPGGAGLALFLLSVRLAASVIAPRADARRALAALRAALV